MSRMIARALAVAAIAGAPLVLGVSGAAATGGCTVNNAATSSSSTVTVVVNPLADPPVTVTVDSTSLTCSYTSGGGQVNWGCTLAAGRCQVFVNGLLSANCVAYANTSCASYINVAPGDVVTLSVTGGSGYVADAV